MGSDLCYFDSYEESHLEIRSEINETINTFSKKSDKGFKRWCQQLKDKEEDEFILELSTAANTVTNSNEKKKA